jgi:hypothetical protein
MRDPKARASSYVRRAEAELFRERHHARRPLRPNWARSAISPIKPSSARRTWRPFTRAQHHHRYHCHYALHRPTLVLLTL